MALDFPIALALALPVYGYLHVLNAKLAACVSTIKDCPYCNRKVEMKHMEEKKPCTGEGYG